MLEKRGIEVHDAHDAPPVDRRHQIHRAHPLRLRLRGRCRLHIRRNVPHADSARGSKEHDGQHEIHERPSCHDDRFFPARPRIKQHAGRLAALLAKFIGLFKGHIAADWQQRHGKLRIPGTPAPKDAAHAD